MPDDTKVRRLRSLDLLRGLDMMLLTVIGPFVIALNSACGLPDQVLAQFRHSWVGFSFWDIIMPLFIFASGAAVPFAMKKADGRSRRLEILAPCPWALCIALVSRTGCTR